MGLGGVNIWQLLIILVIVLLLFGTKKLKGIGGDLGGAVKGFKDSLSGEDESEEDKETEQETASINKDNATSSTADQSTKEENKTS